MREVGLGDGERPAQLVLPGALGPHEHVLPDARREERRLLEGHRHQLAQPLPGHGGDVRTVQGDPPRGRLVQPRHQGGERRLPGTRGPDQGHRLAGPDPQIDPGQHGLRAGLGVGIAELHPSKTISPRSGPSSGACPATPDASASSATSITSKNRWVAVADSWLIASRKPIDSIGQRSASAVERKATRVPAERSPSATWTVPITSAAPMASSGSRVMEAQMPARSRALASSVERSRSVRVRKARAWLRCRPKPLMMRMPSTLSSTTVVRSPTWSWAWRATAENFVSKTRQRIISGAAGASSTSPSVHCCISRMTKPIRTVAPLTRRKVSGKARN